MDPSGLASANSTQLAAGEGRAAPDVSARSHARDLVAHQGPKAGWPALRDLLGEARRLVLAAWAAAYAAARGTRAGAVVAEGAAVVGLVAVVGLYFRESLATGTLAAESDTLIFYYPIFHRLSDVLRSGALPLWTPFIFGGYPLLADGESGALYPPHILALLLLPVNTAFLWLRPVRFAQGALSMYALCRVIGLGRAGAAAAGLVFGLGGFATAQLHHTNISTAAVWLPLILCLVEAALRASGARRYALLLFCGVAFGLQALIIHVQIVLMTGLAFVTYVGWRVVLGPVAGTATRSTAAATAGNRLRALLGTSLLAPPAAFTRLLRHRVLERLVLRWQRVYLTTRIAAAHLSPLRRPVGIIVARFGLLLAVLAVPPLVGMGLAAAQLLPLYELSTFSFRGEGVSYAFASQYSVPPAHLITLVLPDFFVAGGAYWGAWSRWEIFPYVGITPLLLAVIGLLFARARTAAYFALLAACGLLFSLGEHSPGGLHTFLSQLPGFDVLRAPGRFLLLFTVGMAVLAGYGLDYCSRTLRRGVSPVSPLRRRIDGALFGAVLVLFQITVLAAPLALALADSYVESNKVAAMEVFNDLYGRLRGFDRQKVTVEQLYLYVKTALDVDQPSTLRQLALLLATGVVPLVWDRLRALFPVWQIAILALIAADLLAVGATFHPSLPVSALAESPAMAVFLRGQPGLYRVFSEKQTRDEPNRLMPFRVEEANGYSSLPLHRHERYVAQAGYAENRLLDLFNVRYVVVPNRFVPKPSFELTSYDPRQPLVSSTGRNAAGQAHWVLEDPQADSLRVVSTLRDAALVPQGTTVATLQVVDDRGASQLFSLQAGVHTADWAAERPDLRGRIAHQTARVAHTWQEPLGPLRPEPRFAAHLYYAEFGFGGTRRVREVRVQFLHPSAQVQVYGLSLQDPLTRSPVQLDRFRQSKWRQAYADKAVVAYENLAYLPRAFLVPGAVVESSADDVLNRIAVGQFSPERAVVLERSFDPQLLGSGTPAAVSPVALTRADGTEIQSASGMVRVIRHDPMRQEYDVDARANAVLFMADAFYPGWQARIDGKAAEVHRANFLFRAVFVPRGRHLVELTYWPLSFRAGLLITGLTATAIVLALAVLAGRALRQARLTRATRRSTATEG